MPPPQMDSGEDSPLVVVVGGVDPGGGAGLLRDVETARARAARVWAVGTAWTEQDGGGAHRVEPRDADAIGDAIGRAIATGRPAAIKIGMAAGPATAAAIIAALDGFAGPVVVDPVLATSRGGSLWSAAPRALLPLLRRATLVTPNAGEAAALTGVPVETVADAEAAARRLIDADGVAAALVKGGHLRAAAGDAVTDVLATADGSVRFAHARTAGPSPRGTGCALATAIAVELARGRVIEQAIRAAADWLAGAIAGAADVGGERRL